MDNETLDRVWAAIARELTERGDVDIRAGLGWLDQDAQRAIAAAAIGALGTGGVGAIMFGGGGGGGAEQKD